MNPRNLWLAGFLPGPCLVYREECFSLVKSYQCSGLPGRGGGLVGTEEVAGTLTPLLEPPCLSFL